MAKLNSIGVKVKDIDRIFANAIRRIAEGDEEYSCCAIGKLDQFAKSPGTLEVRQLYVDALAPRPRSKRSHNLLCRVIDYVGHDNNDESQGFRILMLSLVKAAWRDLV